jgi:MSHA biogenesis protein MshN
MGLGISLQAEKRITEAVAAYERATESPNLTPQLRAFVDRRLLLLSR